MATLIRMLSRLFLVVLLLLGIIAAIWAYGRLTSPTAAQREAIALMQAEAPGPGAGENGFPALLDLPSAPQGPVPAALNCGIPPQPTCIALIESAPEAGAAAIESYRARLEAAAHALHAPVFRDVRENTGATDLPAFQPLTQLDSLRALDFAAGDTLGALSAACADARGAARWAVNPNTLIEGMLGVIVFREQSALIAEMRRQAPGDALPESCLVLAEPPDAAKEGTLCAAMRGEYRWLVRLLRASGSEIPPSAGPQWMEPVLHDVDWLLARSAERFSATCGPAAEAAAREDRAAGFARVEQRWVDHVAFPVSVVLDHVAEPAYLPYPERQLDFVAQRRVLAAMLQMDAMAPALTNAERFAALPAALRDGPRPLVLADDGASVSVPLRSRRSEQEGGEFRLPLPALTPPPAVVSATLPAVRSSPGDH